MACVTSLSLSLGWFAALTAGRAGARAASPPQPMFAALTGASPLLLKQQLSCSMLTPGSRASPVTQRDSSCSNRCMPLEPRQQGAGGAPQGGQGAHSQGPGYEESETWTPQVPLSQVGVTRGAAGESRQASRLGPAHPKISISFSKLPEVLCPPCGLPGPHPAHQHTYLLPCQSHDFMLCILATSPPGGGLAPGHSVSGEWHCPPQYATCRLHSCPWKGWG